MLSPEVVEGSGVASGDHHFGDGVAEGGEVVGVVAALLEDGAGGADGLGAGDTASPLFGWEAAGMAAGDNHHLGDAAAGGTVAPVGHRFAPHVSHPAHSSSADRSPLSSRAIRRDMYSANVIGVVVSSPWSSTVGSSVYQSLEHGATVV
jgi:hypothetical protein